MGFTTVLFVKKKLFHVLFGAFWKSLVRRRGGATDGVNIVVENLTDASDLFETEDASFAHEKMGVELGFFK
ncbi:MAG TPA: hypothetical protein P5160_07185 [Candidatus Omnitrophota bacterium]|jgi:hypothetical protein|nr:hypothetical protein [Candidatus Omnitrophota bacterium]